MKKCLFVVVSFLLFLIPVFVSADSANIGGYGNTVQIMDSNEVQMVNEQIKMFVTEKEVSTLGKEEGVILTSIKPVTEVEVSYTFKNITDEDINVRMGFPELRDTGAFPDEFKLNDFKATYEDGSEIEIIYELGDTADYEKPNFYTYEVPFSANQQIIIKNSYWILNSIYKNGPWFNYVLETGASWKGVIEQVDIEVSFMDGLSVYDINKISPQGFNLDETKNVLTWNLTDLEPTEDDNIEVRYDTFPPTFYGGCSGFDAELPVSNLSEWTNEYIEDMGSSYLVEDDYGFYPCRAYDGDNETAWVEGGEGHGVGESINIDSSTSEIEISKIFKKIRVFNGYGISEDLWGKNNRVKDLKITFSNGTEQIVTLSDIYGYQEINLPTVFLTNLTDSQAKVEIASVYEGTDFDDTVISEIRLLGLLQPEIELINQPFSDISNHKYEEAINYIYDQGIVEGYENGTYKPDETINRAELLKIIIEAIFDNEFENYGNESCFTDVPANEWYTKYVCFAKNEQIVKGYEDGSFKPDQKINFVEALKISLLGFSYEHTTGEIDDIFNEAESQPWYFNYVKEAIYASSIPSDIVSADQNFSRGQMAEMITRIQKIFNNELADYIGDEWEDAAILKDKFKKLLDIEFISDVSGCSDLMQSANEVMLPLCYATITNNFSCEELGEGWTTYGNEEYDLGFCYKKEWGDVELKETTIDPTCRKGTLYSIIFSNQKNINLSFSTQDYEFLCATDSVPTDYNLIDFSKSNEELSAEIYHNMVTTVPLTF